LLGSDVCLLFPENTVRLGVLIGAIWLLCCPPSACARSFTPTDIDQRAYLTIPGIPAGAYVWLVRRDVAPTDVIGTFSESLAYSSPLAVQRPGSHLLRAPDGPQTLYRNSSLRADFIERWIMTLLKMLILPNNKKQR